MKSFTNAETFQHCAVFIALCVLAMAASVGAQPAGCPTGMTHYWHLDEGAAPYADSYGTNDANCTNCPTSVAGILGGAQRFDGITDRVDIPDDDSFDWSATTSFTIEFWMKTNGCTCTGTGFNCNQVIVGRAGTSNAWWIGVNCQTTYASTGQLRCAFGPGDLPSTTFVDDNLWHHVVFQFDAGAGQYRLYVDGALDNSVSAGGVARSGAGPLGLGYFSTDYQYNGDLDELALYNAAIPLSDIQAHYNAGAGALYCSGVPSPVVTDIPNQTVAAGTPFTAINLDDYVSDGDNADSELNWTYAGNTDLTVDIDVNRIATVTAPSPGWSGSETITFTATDPTGGFDSDDATFAVPPPGCEPGISHYWYFEETSSPYADVINGLDATCTNCPTAVTGQVNGAQDFAGDKKVVAADDGSFDWSATTSFTIEFWMKSNVCECTQTGFDCNQVIVGRFGISNPWWIGVNCQEPEEQLLRCFFGSGNIYSSTPATNNAWRHIALVFDHVAGEYRLYINGALDGTSTAAGMDRSGSTPLQIGHVNGGNFFYYDGLLDELALYSVALDASAIAQHHDAGLSGAGYCNLPPVASCQAVTVLADGSCQASASIDNGSYDPEGGTITLEQVPPGPYPIGTTEVTLVVTDESGAVASCTSPVTVVDGGYGSLTGTITATCNGSSSPSLDVTVDVYDGDGILVFSTASDAAGNYWLDGIPSGQTYTVEVILPLGYSAPDSNAAVEINCGATTTLDFSITCNEIVAQPRSKGFWKHQVGVALGGNGNAQIDGETLCAYLDLIENHFNFNAINQVIVYEPASSGLCSDNLEVAKSLLNLKGKSEMIARARQQLTALLLNVASEKISLTEVISEDGATVSQAITHCDLLIDDPQGDHEMAKDICDLINNGSLVSAGMIPLNTDNIAYKSGWNGALPDNYELTQNYPNPFNPGTEISFGLPSRSEVKLEVMNLLGQVVTTVYEGNLQAGIHSYKWDGSAFASGVYFYRLRAGAFISTKKMILLK